MASPPPRPPRPTAPSATALRRATRFDGALTHHEELQAVCARFEQAVGGRRRLAETLLAHATRDDQQYLVGLLVDPSADPTPLGAVLAQGKVSFAALVTAYRDAKLASATTAALDRVADALPDVAASVMTRALPQKRPCPLCEGIGTHVREPSVADPNPTPKDCVYCDGVGFVYRDTTVAEQKLALDIGRLTPKAAPTVAISMQQTTQTAHLHNISYDAFTKATDRLLYGDPRDRRARTAAGAPPEESPPVVEAVVTDVPPPKTTPP